MNRQQFVEMIMECIEEGVKHGLEADVMNDVLLDLAGDNALVERYRSMQFTPARPDAIDLEAYLEWKNERTY